MRDMQGQKVSKMTEHEARNVPSSAQGQDSVHGWSAHTDQGVKLKPKFSLV